MQKTEILRSKTPKELINVGMNMKESKVKDDRKI